MEAQSFESFRGSWQSSFWASSFGAGNAKPCANFNNMFVTGV